MSRSDDRPALVRATDAAAGLKSGTWESVHALAVLGMVSRDASVLERAHTTAAGLKPGTWESVVALARLAEAEQDLGSIA